MKRSKRKIIHLFVFAVICMFILLGNLGWYGIAVAQPNTLALLPEEICLTPGDIGTFDLALANNSLITGIQFRLTYTAAIGFQITDVTLTSRTTGFELPSLQVAVDDSGKTEALVMLYSLHDAAIIPGNGSILAFHYQTSLDATGIGSLTFTEAQLVNMALESVEVTSHHGLVRIIPPASLEKQEEDISAIPEFTSMGYWLIGLGLLWALRKMNSISEHS